MNIVSKIATLADVRGLKYLILIDSLLSVLISPVFLYGVFILLCFATDSPQANNLPTYAMLLSIFCLFLLYFWSKFVVLVVLFKRIFTKNLNPSFKKSFNPLFTYNLIVSAPLYLFLLYFFNA